MSLNKPLFEENAKTVPPNAKSSHAGVAVKILDYDVAKHLVKIVRADNGQPLVGKITTEKDIVQEKQIETKNKKVLKTLPTKEGPIVEVDDEQSSIRGSSQYGFHSSNKFGNIVRGPISIVAKPHEVRLSGVTTLNPLITSGFASTVVTPVPTVVFSIPSAKVLAQMSKDIATIGAMMGF